MKNNYFKKIHIVLSLFGINIINIYYSILCIPSYLLDLIKISIQLSKSKYSWKFNFFPILSDKYSAAGSTNTQYFIQDLYFARLIYERRPENHLDIGSRLDGFISHLLVFTNVDVIDIRELKSDIFGLRFIQSNVMDDSVSINKNSYSSVSCLHTIEHFGLGRYGDPIDLNGWTLGLANILNYVSHGGIFYLSTPIGKKRIEFNAHRVFDPSELISFVEAREFKLEKFDFLDDDNNLVLDVDKNKLDFISTLNYGCGFFVFKRN